MKIISFVAAMIMSLLVTLISCKHEILTGNPGPDPSLDTTPITGIPCSSDSVYFKNTIQPLLISSCASPGCHDQVSQEEGIVINSYSNIMKLVVAGKATESKLFKVITLTGGEDRMPPEPGKPLTTDQVNSIKKWISQGAKNNACDACDTSDFTYSTGVLPIIQNKCIGCHNINNPGGSIDLSSYEKTYAVAMNGKLLGSIQWSGGYIKMPQGGSKLPACEITQIQKWIDNGAPKN